MNGYSASTVSHGWQGHLSLDFAYTQGTTELILRQVQAPLKVQRPFYPEGPEICHSIILHTAGGIVGGDRLSVNLHLQPNAQALITNAAATKIYRSSGKIQKQDYKIHIENEACLEWLPQEMIVFNGAIYQQHLQVELAPQASWLGWELIRLGRSARGEKFEQGQWRSHLEIWRQGQPLWIDRQQAIAGTSMINSLHGLGGKPVFGTLAWIGTPISPAILQELQQRFAHPCGGITRLSEGLVCRYLGNSTLEAKQWFFQLWRFLRPVLRGREAKKARVWLL